MVESVLLIDYDKCTGCRSCEIACSLARSGEVNPQKSRIRVVRLQEVADMIPVPVVCMHCEKPPCEAVCPMKAINTEPKTRARRVDDEKCIGCSACVYACPFGAIAVDRSVGYAFVCSLCDGDPTCVKFCSANAIQYISGDEVTMRLRRGGMEKYLELVKAGREEVV